MRLTGEWKADKGGGRPRRWLRPREGQETEI